MRRSIPCAIVPALLLAACAGEIGGVDDDDIDDDDPVTCPTTRTYTGFGNSQLDADRPQIEAGSDRLRLKPFSALATEYARAVGLDMFNTQVFAATFGRPPARWFSEPQASANTIYAAFALAYDACSRHTMTDAMYENAPAPTSAGEVCRSLALRAWHREATDAEVASCVTYGVDQTNPADEPRRRWAYTCAAVLSATGFLAY
jgi:hypothetical protein